MDVRDTLARVIAYLLGRLSAGSRRTIAASSLNVIEALQREEREGTPAGQLLQLKDVFDERIENLTVEQYRQATGVIRAYVIEAAEGQFRNEKHGLKRLILHFATVENVVRFLSDDNTLYRMARIDPVARPAAVEREEYAGRAYLKRTGHPDATDNLEIAVSANLYGSRLVSYFYLGGEEFPDPEVSGNKKAILQKLVVHDSDEFVYFLPEQTNFEVGKLPIFIEGSADPYQRVWQPIEFRGDQWLLIDAKSPHYWFAKRDAVAFYVGAAAGGLWRKPIAFGWEHRDASPGGSYLPFELKRLKRRQRGAEAGEPPSAEAEYSLEELQSKVMQNLLGKRLRRRRDAYQISAERVEELNVRKSRIGANTIGKIENASLETVHLRTLEEYAEAMDMTLSELFVRNPPYERNGRFEQWDSETDNAPHRQVIRSSPVEERQTGYRLPPSDSKPRAERLFHRNVVAIRPYLVQFKKRTTSEKLKFWQGEADVAVLVRTGTLRVFVAPDPLRLAIDLAGALGVGLSSDALHACFELEEAQLEELLFRRRLVVMDDVHSHAVDGRASHEAYHFNAGLPHAVIPANDEPTSAIVATIRNDSHLPHCWVFGRRERASDSPDRS
jgi:transcriptional regulator with XRE-family HTH domain